MVQSGTLGIIIIYNNRIELLYLILFYNAIVIFLY